MYQGSSSKPGFDELAPFWKKILSFFDRLVNYGGNILDMEPCPKKPVRNWNILWFHILHITIHGPLLLYIIFGIIESGTNSSEGIVLITIMFVVLFINTVLLILGIFPILGNQYSQVSTLSGTGRSWKIKKGIKLFSALLAIIILLGVSSSYYSYLHDPTIAARGELGGLGAIFILFIPYFPACFVGIILENIYIKRKYYKVSALEYSQIRDKYNTWKNERKELLRNF